MVSVIYWCVMALRLSHSINLQNLYLLMNYFTKVKNLNDQEAAIIFNSLWCCSCVIPLFLQIIVDTSTGLQLMTILTSFFYCTGLLGLVLLNVKELSDTSCIHVSIGILLVLGIGGHYLNLEELMREEDQKLSKHKQVMVVFVSLLVQVIGVLIALIKNLWQERFIFGFAVMVSGTICFVVGICLYKPITSQLREREKERGGNNSVPKICMILPHLITSVVLCVGDSFYIVQASRLRIDCQDLAIIVQMLRIECINGKIIQLVLKIGYYVAKEFIGLLYSLIGGSIKKQKKYAIWGFGFSLFMAGLSCYRACLVESMIVKAKKGTEKTTLPHYSLIWPQLIFLAAADKLAEKSLDLYFSFPRSKTDTYIRLLAYLFSGFGMILSSLFSKLVVNKYTTFKTAANFITGTTDAYQLDRYFILLFMTTIFGIVFLSVVCILEPKLYNGERIPEEERELEDRVHEGTDYLPALEDISASEVVEPTSNDHIVVEVESDDQAVADDQARKRKYDELIEETERKRTKVA